MWIRQNITSMGSRTLRGARCLVTGASSGLGRALTAHLVHEGAQVVTVARSADRLLHEARRLNERSPGCIFPIAADLTEPDDRRRVLAGTADHFGGSLDLAINCAGVGAYGRFESHDESVMRHVFEIN